MADATHKDWLARWAKRRVEATRQYAQNLQESIAELRRDGNDLEMREASKVFIEEHEKLIDAVKAEHERWRCIAERRFGLDLPELTGEAAEPDSSEKDN